MNLKDLLRRVKQPIVSFVTSDLAAMEEKRSHDSFTIQNWVGNNQRACQTFTFTS